MGAPAAFTGIASPSTGGYNWNSPQGETAYQQGSGANSGWIQSYSADGTVIWINGTTGEIRTGSANSTNGYGQATSGGNGLAATKANQYGLSADQLTKQNYDAGKDYGLGKGMEGIIVVARDKNGAPTQYYAAKPGGGGQVFSDLSQAQTSAQEAKKWTSDRNPDQTRAAGIAGGIASQQASPSWVAANPQKPAEANPQGSQVTPGVGEETQKKNASQYDQPSQAEQQWNGLAGQFNNWDASGLEGVYDRGQKKTQVALENRASAGGYGDSSAAARATSNIGQDFTDRKTQAMENWAKTGMGLAGAADSGKNTRLGQQMGEATTSQNLKLNRETGGLTSAMQLGQGLAGTTQTATNAANTETAGLTTDLTNLLMAKGAVNQAQAQSQAKSAVDSLTGMGLTAAQISKILGQQFSGTMVNGKAYSGTGDPWQA